MPPAPHPLAWLIYTEEGRTLALWVLALAVALQALWIAGRDVGRTIGAVRDWRDRRRAPAPTGEPWPLGEDDPWGERTGAA